MANVTVTDALGLGTPTLLKPDYRIMGPDAIGVSTTSTAKVTYARSTIDAIGLSESVTRQSNALRSVTDALGTSDAILEQVTYLRIILDVIGIGDTFQVLAIHGAQVIQVIDAIGVATSHSAHVPIYSRSIADAMAIAAPDANLRVTTSYSRLVTDSVGLSDVLVRSVIYARLVIDAIGLGDTVSRSIGAFIIIVGPFCFHQGVAYSPGGNEGITYCAGGNEGIAACNQ